MKYYLIRLNKWWVTFIIIGFGICCTIYISVQVKLQLQQESKAKLFVIAKQIQLRIDDSIQLATNDIEGLQALYLSSKEPVSLEEFNAYTKVLFDSGRDYIQALSWVPIVRQEQRNSYEITMQKRYPDFHITERNEQGEVITRKDSEYYYPVTFMEPVKVNRKALGFDINSNSIRRVALDFARDTGNIAATARIRLVQEVSDSFGFLMLLPVYNIGVPLNNPDQRRSALRGFISGVFRINNLLEQAQVLAHQENLSLSLIDYSSTSKDKLYGDNNLNADFSFILSLPQRDWQLNLMMDDKLRNRIEYPQTVIWIISGGILLSALFGICVYELLKSRVSERRIKQLNQQIQKDNLQLETVVAKRTEDLLNKNKVLETQTVQLEHSNRDLSDFASVASHDLKSPLRGIDQLASWVIEDLNDGNMKEIPDNLALMRQRVQRLESLLNDLLAYSRIGKGEVKVSEVDCDALVEELFLLNAPPPKFVLSKDNLPVFSTIVVPFEQILRNLLSNAIKHHDKDEGHIDVNCLEENDFYTFSVSDDGSGIDSKHHERIFKIFKTLKSRDEVEGSGMGLSIIQRTVEYYGGKVYLESEVGKGTTFYFSWPKNIEKTTNNNKYLYSI